MTIFTKTSTDGRNWTPKTVFLKSSVRKKLDYVSPAIIYEKGKYKIWYVDKKMCIILKNLEIQLQNHVC